MHGTSPARSNGFMVWCFTRMTLCVKSVSVDMIQEDKIRYIMKWKYISYKNVNSVHGQNIGY